MNIIIEGWGIRDILKVFRELKKYFFSKKKTGTVEVPANQALKGFFVLKNGLETDFVLYNQTTEHIYITDIDVSPEFYTSTGRHQFKDEFKCFVDKLKKFGLAPKKSEKIAYETTQKDKPYSYPYKPGNIEGQSITVKYQIKGKTISDQEQKITLTITPCDAT